MKGSRTELLLEDAVYQKRLYDYDASDNLIYIGKHEHIHHDEGTTGWKIWKNTWDGGNKIMTEGPLIGTWTRRASLDWATPIIDADGDPIVDAEGQIVEEA